MEATIRTRSQHLLTAREVVNAPTGDHSDGHGLQLRIDRGASWVLRYTAPSGKRREMGLGPCTRDSVQAAGHSLAGAREAARKARDLLRQGIDPLDERDRRRQEAVAAEEQRKAAANRERWTLARCARAYHETEIEPSTTTKHAAQWISSLETHVPAELWHAPVDSITAPALLAALQAAERHPSARGSSNLAETLRRVRQRLDSIFEDAQFHGRCTTNPAAAIGRKLAKARPKKAGQFAALDYRQAPALMARLRATEGIAARALEFAILTAARTAEVLGASWDEIDLAAGIWTVPGSRMKKGQPHAVYLSSRALEIIEGMRGYDPRYIFPSLIGGPGKHASAVTLQIALGRLGVRDRTTVHGLCRATFSTWASETAAARPDVIEACLAHREADKIRAAYNRADFAVERRALLAAWATYLGHSVELQKVAG